MSKEVRPDLSCVPFPKRILYLVLTVPLLLILVLVFVLLWAYGPLLSLIFLLLFLATCYFQSYCCAYQECPYIGHFCPAIAGIVPASLLARFIYRSKRFVKSERKFRTNIVLATTSWLALAIFPLFWIARVHTLLAVAYIACHLAYSLTFSLTICPYCAIRDTCPGGKLQRALKTK